MVHIVFHIQYLYMYIYLCSSVTNPSPNGSTECSYQITENRTYREEDEEQPTSPPPTVPPRNYRTSRPSSAGTTRLNKLPPAEPPLHPYDNTPKAESYADQLRQQSRRLSTKQGFHPSRGVLKDIQKPHATNNSFSKPIMPTAQDINSMTNTVYEQHSDNLIVSTPNIHHSTMPNSSPDTSFNSSLSPCGIHDSGSHRLSDSAPHLSSSRPGSIGTSRSNLYVNEETMESTNHPSHHHTQNEG